MQSILFQPSSNGVLATGDVIVWFLWRLFRVSVDPIRLSS